MKNKFLLFAVVSVLLFAVSSCKQNVPKPALFVPKDASSVFVIDGKAITDKIKSSGITLDSIANMFNKHENGLHWSDIENSGIDLSKPFFVFNKQANSMQSGKTQSFGLIAQVADKSKLENFLQKQTAGAAVKQDSKYKYIDIGDGNVAGWNDDVLIISGVEIGVAGKTDETQSHQQLTTLFTQPESNSVASIDEFKNALNKPGDIHFWSNASGNLNAIPMLGMTKLGTLFGDTYTDGTIDFENGKIIASAQTHYNKTFSDILGKYSSREIDKSMISRYPQPVNGFGIAAFNLKILLDILHYLGYNSMADGYLSQMGFTTNDVVNAFSGDIAFLYSGFKMEEQNIPGLKDMGLKGAHGQFLLNIKIGDKAAFNKVMNGLVNKNILSKNGDQYQLGFFGGHDFVMETTNDNLFIASDDTLVKAYEAGNSKSALPDNTEKGISNKSMAVYVDIASILQKTNSSDTSAVKAMQAAQATFKNFIASADKSDSKSTTGNFELNTINTNENSLASLVKFIAVAHHASMDHKNQWDKYSHDLQDSLHDEDDEPQKDSQ